MIYNHNVITKEQKQALVEREEGRNKILFYGIAVALLTFSLHLMLRTLTYNVLSAALPQLMIPSYFSTLSLYIVMAFILYTVYTVRYYDFPTYAEISQDKWYTLVKNGYAPHRMILVKLLMRLSEATAHYTIGFLVTLFLTIFLKYPSVISYILSLCICGLIDLILLSLITMSAPLFISRQGNTRYMIIIDAVCIQMLRL